MKRVSTVMWSCPVALVISFTHFIKDTNCHRLPANKNHRVGATSHGWDSNLISLHNGGLQFDHLKPAKVFTPSNFRSKRSLPTCDVTSNTCQQTASLQSDTEVWKNVCYMDSSNKVHACSEICLQSHPGYDEIDCHFRYCKNFLRTCPEEQEAVAWVNSLHCDVSNEMCQEGGLPHTEYFNISCYKHDVGEHYGSCAEICNSGKFTHKRKCDAYCSTYKDNCFNSKDVTTRKPPVTSPHRKPSPLSPTKPAISDETNSQSNKNKRAKIGGSVGGTFAFVVVLVVVTWCLCRKGQCGRKVALLQRQASGTVSAATSAVKEAGSRLVSQLSQEPRSGTVMRQESRGTSAEGRDGDVEMQGMSNFNNEVLEIITGVDRDTVPAAVASGPSGPSLSRLSSIASVDPDRELNPVEGASDQPRRAVNPDSAKPIKRIGSSSASLKRLGRSASVHPSNKSLERSDSYVQAGQDGSERRPSLTGQGGSERRTSLGGRRTSRSSLSRRLSIRSGGDDSESTALLDGSDGETDSVFSPQSPREVIFE